MELSKGMRLGALIANTANSNNNHGIYLNDSSNNNTISDNHLTDNEVGIVANYSENQIYDNYINDRSAPQVPFIAPVLTVIILGMASIFLKRK